jgi:hypothetical protein
MSRRKKWLIVSGLIVAGLLAGIFLAAPRQPQYEGRPLSDWLADLSSPDYKTQRVARTAIQAMGPEVIPFLTNSLAQRDSFSVRAYRRNLIPRRLAGWSHRFVKWQTPVMESRSAAVALQSLGPQATNAIPSLVAALQDPSWMVAQAATTALIAMGTNAVPTLGARLTNATLGELPWVLQALAAIGTNTAPLAPQLADIATTDAAVGAPFGYAVTALARAGPDALPVITNRLATTTNVMAQLRLLNALKQMGEAAMAVTNTLFELMRSTNAAVRLSAREAFGNTLPSRDLGRPIWLEGLNDPDAKNAEVSLHFLTMHPSNVHVYNREIEKLTRHPTASLAAMASNALTRFNAWPEKER